MKIIENCVCMSIWEDIYMYTVKVDHDFKCFKLETLNAFYYTHKNELSCVFSYKSFIQQICEWMEEH